MNTNTMRVGLAALAASALLLGGCGPDKSTSSSPAATASGAASAAPSSAPATPDGNGVAALDPTAILAQAKAALKSAGSFRVKGDVSDSGQKISLNFEADGTNSAGTITVGAGEAEVLKLGTKQYIKGNASFWKVTASVSNAKVVKLVENRWVLVPSSNKSFDGFFNAVDADQLLTPSGTVTKGTTKTIAGIPALGLIDKSSDGGTLWIATTGKPYPLEIDAPTAADGSMNFSDFGTKFTDIKTPSNVLDLSKAAG